jgi:hypothetical protein
MPGRHRFAHVACLLLMVPAMGVPASIIVSELNQSGFRHLTTMSRWLPDDDRSQLFLVLFEKP